MLQAQKFVRLVQAKWHITEKLSMSLNMLFLKFEHLIVVWCFKVEILRNDYFNLNIVKHFVSNTDTLNLNILE